MILVLLPPFAGMGTGDLVVLLLGSVVLAHILAAVTGALLLERSWKRIAIVLCIAMFPALLYSVDMARDAWYLRFAAVYDRFRDELANPIPGSVSNLEFVPLEEAHELHLMFRFTIAPEELDGIIHAKGFRRIEAAEFRRPDDLFTHPQYLPLPGPVTFYIINDIQAGYADKGIGEGYTLKVSGDRRQVVFRRESAAYYLYRYWDGDVQRASEERFLNALREQSTNQGAPSAE
jgi:hypothetical protein